MHQQQKFQRRASEGLHKVIQTRGDYRRFARDTVWDTITVFRQEEVGIRKIRTELAGCARPMLDLQRFRKLLERAKICDF
jgi:hypothetical protein